MDDLERLRSIGQIRTKGKAQVTRLSDDRKRTTGFEVEYRDGRQEAVVRPKTIKRRLSISGDNDE